MIDVNQLGGPKWVRMGQLERYLKAVLEIFRLYVGYIVDVH